jgi:Outer membrane protein beta-barrel domain
MNDKDFDKIFSQKLKEEKGVLADEKSWETLATKLEEHDRNKAVGNIKTRHLAWLLPLILLFLGVNIWSLMKMNDTIIQIQYVYKTDTIFIQSNNFNALKKNIPYTGSRVKSLSKNITQATPSVSKAFQDIKEIERYYTTDKRPVFKLKTTDTIQETAAPLVGLSKNLIVLNGGNKQKTWDVKQNLILENNHIENESTPKNQTTVIPLPILNALIKQEKTVKPDIVFLNYSMSVAPPIIESSKINQFYIGSSVGFINYHTLWLNRDGLEVGRNEKSYQVGAKVEYALTNKWRLTASADYCPYDFDIKWLDNRYNLPPKPSYYDPTTATLNSLKGHQKLHLGSMGLKYVFTTNNRFHPYFGTSYTAMRITPYDAEYTYTHTSTGRTYTKTSTLVGGANILNIALFNGGLEYRLQKHLALQADIFYYKDMNRIKKTYDLYGLRGAFLIAF